MIQIVHGDWQPSPKPVHADHLISAIGDVHGRADLLEPLLEALAEDVPRPGVEHATNIFLGDLIDRGPDVLNTLGLAAGGLGAFVEDRAEVRDVLILGNHDRWLRDALLGDPEIDEILLWDHNGAEPTWTSLGLPPRLPPERVAPLLRERVPEIVTEAMARMQPMIRIGDYVFAHAGLDPRRSLEDQPEETVLWIRDPFLHPAEGWPFDVVVIHGHTPEDPYEAPTVANHRINLDTGAVFTGVLTALQMRNDQMRFVQAMG